jgi:N-acetylglucosaminyl-diphospho-decaprenol L-rhamnosyltransferase
LTPGQNPEGEKQPPRVSVVVVSHNRAALLRRSLEALEKSDGRDRLQLIVVDNGSYDGSAQLAGEFPHVQFALLPRNFGLTKALNIGWRAADAEYVLFLHEDAEVLQPETVLRLADVLDANEDAAAACPLLVDADGRPAPQLGSFPPNGEYHPAEPPGNEPFPVDYPSGAALMTRVFLIKAIRQIDEHYGQFGSDADLAAQFRRSSRKILLVPTLPVRHIGGSHADSLERADLLLGQAVFWWKYRGFAAGLRARIMAVLKPLVTFDLGVARYTIAGQKIDGTQG